MALEASKKVHSLFLTVSEVSERMFAASLGLSPVGRRRGYNCNPGTRDFLGQAQLEGDRATTAIWELEFILGSRSSWKATDRVTAAI